MAKPVDSLGLIIFVIVIKTGFCRKPKARFLTEAQRTQRKPSFAFLCALCASVRNMPLPFYMKTWHEKLLHSSKIFPLISFPQNAKVSAIEYNKGNDEEEYILSKAQRGNGCMGRVAFHAW